MKRVLFIAILVVLMLAVTVPVFAGGPPTCPDAPGAAHQSIAACLGGDVVSSLVPGHVAPPFMP
jgi:hypothetical protein